MPSIALALHEFQAVDLAFGNAVVPLKGEPRGNGAQVVLQPLGKANMAMTFFTLVGNSADSRRLAQCRDPLYGNT